MPKNSELRLLKIPLLVVGELTGYPPGAVATDVCVDTVPDSVSGWVGYPSTVDEDGTPTEERLKLLADDTLSDDTLADDALADDTLADDTLKAGYVSKVSASEEADEETTTDDDPAGDVG